MKSLDELNRIREEALKRVNLRQDTNANYRILVGMATCGIAAGARPVMKALMTAMEKDPLPVTLQQTGCIGMCQFEPIVEVINQVGTKTTYYKVTAEMATEIYEKHIKLGQVITAYTKAEYTKVED